MPEKHTKDTLCTEGWSFLGTSSSGENQSILENSFEPDRDRARLGLFFFWGSYRTHKHPANLDKDFLHVIFPL